MELCPDFLAAVGTRHLCGWLCPFGAALALLGRVRILDRIPRRSQCAAPCQTCRHRCDYQAIKPNGEISYAECFQCINCAVIYGSDEKCASLMPLCWRQRGMQADGLSTAFMVMGARKSHALAARPPQVDLMTINKRGVVWKSPTFPSAG